MYLYCCSIIIISDKAMRFTLKLTIFSPVSDKASVILISRQGPQTNQNDFSEGEKQKDYFISFYESLQV